MHFVKIGNEVVNLDMVTHVSPPDRDGNVKVAFPFWDHGDGYAPQEGAIWFRGEDAAELGRVLASLVVGAPSAIDVAALDHNLEGAINHLTKANAWIRERPSGADALADTAIARQFLGSCRNIIGPTKAAMETAK